MAKLTRVDVGGVHRPAHSRSDRATIGIGARYPERFAASCPLELIELAREARALFRPRPERPTASRPVELAKLSREARRLGRV